ncbi:hypothetical protein BJ912DRAFT_1065103 [Pholiota molesta]|nr:hypothetical protein BJ912DRAFT_1065103 [Pholiota molesta]
MPATNESRTHPSSLQSRRVQNSPHPSTSIGFLYIHIYEEHAACLFLPRPTRWTSRAALTPSGPLECDRARSSFLLFMSPNAIDHAYLQVPAHMLTRWHQTSSAGAVHVLHSTSSPDTVDEKHACCACPGAARPTQLSSSPSLDSPAPSRRCRLQLKRHRKGTDQFRAWIVLFIRPHRIEFFLREIPSTPCSGTLPITAES